MESVSECIVIDVRVKEILELKAPILDTVLAQRNRRVLFSRKFRHCFLNCGILFAQRTDLVVRHDTVTTWV